MNESPDEQGPHEYSMTIDMTESVEGHAETVEERVRDLIIARDSQTPMPFEYHKREGVNQVHVRYLEFRDSEGHAVPETSPNIATCFIVLGDALE